MKLPKVLKTAKGRRALAKLALDVTTITGRAAVGAAAAAASAVASAAEESQKDVVSYDGFGLCMENSKMFNYSLPSDGIGGISDRKI